MPTPEAAGSCGPGLILPRPPVASCVLATYRPLCPSLQPVRSQQALVGTHSCEELSAWDRRGGGRVCGAGREPGLEKAWEAQTQKLSRRGDRVSEARRQRGLGQVSSRLWNKMSWLYVLRAV